MVFPGLAIDDNIIVDANDSWAFLKYLVHPHLEHILAHFGSKRHSLVLEPAFVPIEDGEQSCMGCEMYL